ncbi:type VI secretion system baseplate subunit TssE [Massilia sp.]|jgi:type VI secretion system lysozyme-like protein|uniref:type VI secretion system baseplate subunit TssE n=1 Tax=Massilia sp. TaxID=1882437 RepID=UPI0028A8D1FD|nr:type VI secretion system baseplate subunit TssE [Massilia sp.]
MRGARPHTDPARLPLLERLGRKGHGGVLDADGLRASVGAELLRLLNGRSASGRSEGLSVPDYGIPDWTALYAANADDRQRLANGVARAVRAFEPRLRAPQAEVLLHPAGLRLLLVRLRGRLQIGGGQAVTYAITLGSDGARLVAIEDDR